MRLTCASWGEPKTLDVAANSFSCKPPKSLTLDGKKKAPGCAFAISNRNLKLLDLHLDLLTLVLSTVFLKQLLWS